MPSSRLTSAFSRRGILAAAAALTAGRAGAEAPAAFYAGRKDVIDVHAHFIPPAYAAALNAAGLTRLDGGMPVPQWSPQRAVEVMDRYGVAKSILSVSSPGLNFVDVSAEASLARAINETAAQVRDEGRGRFGAFATLPVGDAAASAAEIKHAFDTLKLDGVILETNHRGRYPGHPDFRRLLGALNERKAVVFLHPTSPQCPHCVDGGRPAPLIEFPFDTTRAAVDLIYSGALDAFPDIRFILSHGGGALPYLGDRIAGFSTLPFVEPRPSGPAAVQQAISRFYYDTALANGPVSIQALLAVAPPSHMLFGTDWPFTPEALIGGALRSLTAPNGPAAPHLDAILHHNAARLLMRNN